MASAGYAVVAAGVDTVLFQEADLGGCSEFTVIVPSTAGNPALINVAGLHAAGEYMAIQNNGHPVAFKAMGTGIRKVTAQGYGGGSVVYFGVTERVR